LRRVPLVQRPLAQVPRVRFLPVLSQPVVLRLVRLRPVQLLPVQLLLVQLPPARLQQAQLPPVQRRVLRWSCLSPAPMLSASLTRPGLRAAAVLLCMFQFSYLLQWLSLFQVIFMCSASFIL